MHILFPHSLGPSGSTVASGEQTTWKKLSSLLHQLHSSSITHCLFVSRFISPSFVALQSPLCLFHHPLFTPSTSFFLCSLAMLQEILCSHFVYTLFKSQQMNYRSTSIKQEYQRSLTYPELLPRAGKH